MLQSQVLYSNMQLLSFVQVSSRARHGSPSWHLSASFATQLLSFYSCNSQLHSVRKRVSQKDKPTSCVAVVCS